MFWVLSRSFGKKRTLTPVPTDVELPLIGKIKTNYPALCFVIIAGVLALYAFQGREREGRDAWTISGQFLANPGEEVQWENGELKLLPVLYYPSSANPDGTFDLKVDIPRGKTFEDTYDSIVYVYKTNTNEPRSYEILTGDYAFLKSKTDKSRQYKPIMARAIMPKSTESNP